MKIEEITVKTLDGNTVNLMEIYAGNPLLILFFNIQCLGCVGRAIPLAYDYLQEFKNLNVVGIHTTFGKEVVTKDDIINIFTQKELPFPIYFDIEKLNYEKFECEGTPHWILTDKEGSVIRSIFGSQENAQTRLIYALEELTRE
ncbi:TlpA family protein disulfide reductase [Petrimonas sp.]|uniref:TlpA family protein disulfide reductase n=1 Tax=Petrimonas sp. TaxID=2023866 RepID=UPI003F5197A0